MAFDMIDRVWSAMEDDELYSPSDLANNLEQPVEEVTRVLEFLKKYKFAEQVTKREMIFRKLTSGPSPVDALRVLQMLLGDIRVDHRGRIANVSNTSRRYNAST